MPCKLIWLFCGACKGLCCSFFVSQEVQERENTEVANSWLAKLSFWLCGLNEHAYEFKDHIRCTFAVLLNHQVMQECSIEVPIAQSVVPIVTMLHQGLVTLILASDVCRLFCFLAT